MSDTLYRFRSEGVGDVISAFQRIGDAADKSGAKVEAAMRGATRKGGGAGDPARAQQQRMRAMDRESAQRAQRNRRNADREIRELERKLQKEAQLEARAMKSKERAQTAHDRKLTTFRERRFRAEQRAMQMQERAQDRLRQDRRERFAGMGSRALGVLRTGAMVAGAAALYAGQAAGRQHMSNRDQAIRLAIQGGGDSKALLKSAETASLATPGATTAGVLGATEAFVAKTGNLEAAQQFQKVFAEIAVASSAPLEEIGSAAADLFEKFDIKSIGDMEDALATLVVQGKRGAFELKDAAAQYPKLAAAASVFGFKGKEGLKTLGGLTQIARSATGGPEEAATSLENLFKDLIKNEKEIQQKTGTSIFTDKTKRQTRDITQILPELIKGTKGNQAKLGEVFDIRAKRAISPLFSLFNKTIEEEQKAAAARGETVKETELLAKAEQAVRDKMKQAADSSGAYAEVQRDLAAAQEQSSVQLGAAWDAVVTKVGGELEPAIMKFVSMLSSEEFIGALGLASDKVGEFASSLGAGLDALEQLPVIGTAIAEARKALQERAMGKTPEERILNAQGRIEDRGRKRAGIMRGLAFDGSATEKLALNQMSELSKLDAEDVRLINEESDRRAATDKSDSARGGDFTAERFMNEYVNAHPGLDMPGGQTLARKEAEIIAQRIASGEKGAVPWWMSAPSEEQQGLMDRFKGSVEGGTADIDTTALDNFNAASDMVAAALQDKAAEIAAMKFVAPGGPSPFVD
jgi:hypothetical protein